MRRPLRTRLPGKSYGLSPANDNGFGRQERQNERMDMRAVTTLLASCLVSACIGGKGGAGTGAPPVPTLNTVAISVNAGPAAALGAINHAYVTVRVCVPGSTTQCADIDHVLLDTGSWGLRLVGSTLTADAITLSPETDGQGNTIEECAGFGSGQTWGPVATADIALAGEMAAKVPVQILDDTGAGAPPPLNCGTGVIVNRVTDWAANGVLGVGVFGPDCGMTCTGAATPLAMYFGCTTAGICTAENVALQAQVTNPVTLFASDNNGVIINLPALQNANGDTLVQGELIFGLGTQSDNSLPVTGLTLLGADANGNFASFYNLATVAVPARIDSGTDSYLFDDPTIAICTSAAWVGYYCPVIAPQSLTAMNVSAQSTAAIVPATSSTVIFSVSDPDSFVAGAAAFAGLAGGVGAPTFTWGLPFFYGRPVYIGFAGRSSGAFTGPFYGY